MACCVCRVREVCSVCGLHVRLHVDERAEDEVDSVLYGETGSLDGVSVQYQYDAGGDLPALPAGAAATMPAADNAVVHHSDSLDETPLTRDHLPLPPDNMGELSVC